MKKVWVWMALIVMLVSSCKATPQEEYIVSKRSDGLQKAIEKTPGFSPSFENKDTLFIELAINERLNEKNVFVIVNAKAKFPQSMTLPVYNVKALVFQEAKIQQYLDLSFPDAHIYNYTDRTKKQITQELLEWKRRLSDLMSGLYDAEGERQVQEEKRVAEESIQYLENKYQNAPEEGRSQEQLSLDFTPDEYGESLRLQGKYANNDIGDLYVYNTLVDNWATGGCFLKFERANSSKSNNQESAVEIADDYLKRMIGDKFDYYGAYFTQEVGEDIDKTTTLKYSFQSDNVFTTIIETAMGGAVPADQLAAVFIPENIEMTILRGKVVYLFWRNPCDISLLNQAVDLLPFEDIWTVFERQVFLQNYGSQDVTIQIDDIRLGYYYLPKKNNPGNYMIVPVWDFIGTSETPDGYGIKTPASFVTINAIDGTVINRQLGY